MPYIGKEPEHGNYQLLDALTLPSGVFDGSRTVFNLTADSVAVYPTSPTTLIISLGGVIQEPNATYTVSGNQITFTTAPATSTTFFGVSLGDTLDIGTPSDGSVTTAKLADNAITNVKVATGIDAVKLADGSVTNAELQFINTLSSNAQTQLTAKAPLAGAAFTGAITGVTSLTVDNLNLNGNTLLANSGAVNITPASGSAIVLDGTINIDLGVVTGATSITSTEFHGGGGNLTGISAGISFSGSTTNGMVTYGSSSSAAVESAITFGTAVAGSTTTVLKIEGSYTDYSNGPIQIKTTHASGYVPISFYKNDDTLLATFRPAVSDGSLSIGALGHILFAAGDANADAHTHMRINDTGEVGVLMTSTTLFALKVQNAATSNYGRALELRLGTDFNASNSVFIMAVGGSTQRMYCYSNGNFINSNNSYGQISDERVKTDIEDVNSQWDDIKALRVRNFVKKDSPNHKQIGLISQEVGLISPGLIDHVPPGDFEMEYCGFGHQIEDGTDIDPDTGEETIKYKWVPNTDEEGNDVTMQAMKYSVLHMKAVKALQEAMERIEVLEVEVAALK